MKRIASVYLVLLGFVLAGPLAWGQASVPNLVNFQGRLTDTSGVPLADGAHNLTFSLFDIPSGGSSLWNEAASVTTKDGLFTHQLGSSTLFSQSFFQIYDSLFLEIMVEAEVISPRTLLTSAPYTRLARGLEVTTNSGGLGINTSTAGHNLLINGSDSLNNVDLGGSGFGEIWLRDGTAGNNLIVDLTATTNSGGRLILNKSGGSAGVDVNAGVAGGGSTLNMRNDIGSVTVSFDADGSGNTAAVLPVSSISDIEIQDEPGVASDTSNPNTFVALTGSGIDILNTRSITSADATGTGYVMAIVTAQVIITHTNGTTSNAEFALSESNATYTDTQDQDITIPSSATTGSYQFPITIHGLFDIPQSTSRSYYFLGQEFSGNITVGDINLTLIYFSTARGTVEPLAAGTLEGIDGDKHGAALPLTALEIEAEQADAVNFNSARLEKELAEIKTQRADLEARLQKLEQQIGQNQQAGGSDE